MRGFIKPRFTRLHMPFRAKAERSRHSFHLQAVGLALALLAGVLCGSFWQHASQQNVYLSYFAEQYLAGHNTGGFSAAMSVSFLSAMILQAVVLFFSLSCIGAPVLACVPVLRGIFYRMCIRLPVCLYGDEGSIGQSDPFLAPGYPAIRISGFIHRRWTGYFHKPVPAEFSGTGNRSGHQNQPLPADFCCFLSRYAACGNLGKGFLP